MPLMRMTSRLRSERGVVLFVALIVLIVMTLAGIALLRQMGAGTSIAGNVAFKENATSVADRGIEAARLWVFTTGQTNLSQLSTDSPADGYYSSWGTTVDPTSPDFGWASDVSVAADQASTGNTVEYVIHRLCATPGLSANDPAQHCSDSTANNVGASQGGGSYGGVPASPIPSPYYRITTRVTGPRSTISYTQVMMD